MLAVAILCMLIGAVASATTLVFLLASAPGSTPEQSALLQRVAILTVAVGVAGIGGGIALAVKGRHGWSIGLGLSPVLLALVLLVWAFVRES